MKAPATVRRGTTLRYQVVFTNRTAGDVRLTPCPEYTQSLGGTSQSSPGGTYSLNCSGAGGVIPGGKSVAFEMQIDVPEDYALGNAELRWTFATGTPPLTANVRVI
jgi:hypothetical protein